MASRSHGPSVNAVKRAKYEAKQERRRLSLLQNNSGAPSTPTPASSWASWFRGREEYAAYITVDDVRQVRHFLQGDQKNIMTSNSSTDDVGKKTDIDRVRRISEWISPFFDLKEKPNNVSKDYEHNNNIFISEGTEAVRMLMQRCQMITHELPSSGDASSSINMMISPSSFHLLTILSKPSSFFDEPTKLVDDLNHRMISSTRISKPPFNIVIANEDALSEIAGFSITRGAMACGIIPTYMRTHGYTWLSGLFSSPDVLQPKPIRRLIALDAISNAANMGSIIRTAAAFSMDAILDSEDSCDVWHRQSVRTSMGHVLSVPIIRVTDWKIGLPKNNLNDDQGGKQNELARCLGWLRKEMHVECFAAVVDDDDSSNNQNGSSIESLPELITLDSSLDCSRRSWCCVLGNEGNGIQDVVVRQCDKRIKIGMASGVDSLSLPIAAGILMYGMSRS